MKLIIKYTENNVQKIEIHINECSLVQDIKCKLDVILHGNKKFTSYCYKFIYNTVMIAEHNSIKYYKICENDEIWFGKIDKYLEEDDFVIVYVFYHWGWNYAYEYLILKQNDTISKIRSIIENISSEIINIWNADGKQMEDHQIITDIDKHEDYKLFISCKNDEIYGFETCCYLHNRRWVDRYLFVDRIRDENKDVSMRMKLMNLIAQIKQIISSNDTVDSELDTNLHDFSSTYLNSGFFFRGDMAMSIYHIFHDKYKLLMKLCRCDDNVWKIFAYYSFFAIRAAIVQFFNSRRDIRNEQKNSENLKSKNKSIRMILFDALDYYINYLDDSNNDWQYWLRLWYAPYIIGFFSDDELKNRIDESKIQKFLAKLKSNGNISERFISINPKSVIIAKKTISDILKVDVKHLYCIKPGDDHKPNDADAFDDEFIIEILMSNEDIEILSHLDQGGYGEVLLCKSKLSDNKFALKKQLGAQNDLYRDISIQCQIRNCENIMIYLGLYNIDDNICIAMQYMSEGSIRSYLDEGKRFSENDLLKISYQILLQIRDIHKEGIIHRDIKCDNIVIDKHNAKLIDFGNSIFIADAFNEDLLKDLKARKPGTMRFMAPEILKCEKYTNKIDIWSFGAAMIEMITGKYPYYYLNDLQAMLRIRNTGKIEFEPPKSISQQFIELINLCLNRDPDERPSAEQLIQINIFNLVKSGS